jgi:hypothetical protein
VVGLAASGNLKSSKLKPECVGLLFEKASWPTGWGLYLGTQPGAKLYHSNSFLFETLVDPRDRMILVVRIVLRGLPFSLCFGRPDNPARWGFYHRLD